MKLDYRGLILPSAVFFVCSLLSIFPLNFLMQLPQNVTSCLQVLGQRMLFDNERTAGRALDESQLAKSLHEVADARPRCANHVRQLLMRDAVFDFQAA